jgi:hypothetical protein
MKGYQNLDRFIPFRKADVVEMCITDARLSDSDQKLFRDFCLILESLIHFEFKHQLETLKNCYAPFNPDADTRSIHTYSPQERQTLHEKLVESMTAVLNAANFEKVTETDLKEAPCEESLFKIRLEVDFQDFEEVIFYRRGESKKRETLVKFLGLRKEPIEFTNYERVWRIYFMSFQTEPLCHCPRPESVGIPSAFKRSAILRYPRPCLRKSSILLRAFSRLF